MFMPAYGLAWMLIFPKGRQVDYVLNPFSADELIELPPD
jgi:hypothetical protein